MSKINIMAVECGFCDNGLIVAPQKISKLLGKSIKSFNKNKDRYSTDKLKYYTKLSKNLETFIYTNARELYKTNIITFSLLQPELRQMYINAHMHSIKTYTNETQLKCSFCERYACDYHFVYANIEFFKCIICNQETFKCGWCTTFKKITNKCPDCLQSDPLIYRKIDISCMMAFETDELEQNNITSIKYTDL